MANNHSRWIERVAVVNAIYDDLLVNHHGIDKLVQHCFEKLDFSNFQIKIIEAYVQHYQEQEHAISINLKTTWTYNRLAALTKAIIHTALSEASLQEVDRKIIIDQAIITCERRGNEKDKKFINAILDKLIPKYGKEK